MDTLTLIKGMYNDLNDSKRLLTEIITKKSFSVAFKPGEQESFKQLKNATIKKQESIKSLIKDINE